MKTIYASISICRTFTASYLYFHHTISLMKLKIIPLLIAVILLSVIISCKKETKTQPTASGGPLKGADGSLIYSGAADPSNTLGKTGDYYINLGTGKLFGPKTASSWGGGVAMSLVSANTSGTGQMLTGSGAPDPSLGNAGDFCLDSAAYLLYGPKTASGWGSPVSVSAPGSKGIYYSGWAYGLNPRDTTVDGSALHLATIPAPVLTQNYLTSAAIVVYFALGVNAFPMPYTSYAGGKASVISFLPRPGRILITRFTIDNTNSIPLSTVLQYRYVIIPAGQLLGATQHHVNVNDPEALKAYFHLPE